MHLIDNETKVDLLNNEPIAATVVKLLRSTADTGRHHRSAWRLGAGKSSLLAMIEAAFAADPDVLCLCFNGWLFQGFEDAKVVLLEKIVAELVRSRTVTAKAKDLAKNLMSRIDWLKLAKKAGGLAFTATTGIPTPDLIETVTSDFRKLLENPSEVISKEALKDAVSGAKDILKGRRMMGCARSNMIFSVMVYLPTSLFYRPFVLSTVKLTLNQARSAR
jgi:predicted KAP-like P-loop ATPase